MSDTCPGRDEHGFCIPALWGWHGCNLRESADRLGRVRPCKCPPDLETARQYRIKKILKEQSDG